MLSLSEKLFSLIVGLVSSHLPNNEQTHDDVDELYSMTKTNTNESVRVRSFTFILVCRFSKYVSIQSN